MPSNGQSSLDAYSSPQIFRKDFPIILACDRVQATLLPIRCDYITAPSTGYQAGTVMALNTTSSTYMAYSSGGASGLGSPVCVLFEDVLPASGLTDMGVGIFGGKVWQAKLVGLDANAITLLKAKSYTPTGWNQILSF